MFVAYILTKQNEMVVKFIKNPSSEVFTKYGFEYNIQSSCIYAKKFLWIKYFRWSFYVQDKKDPIKLHDIKGQLESQEVPLDEIAYIIRMLKKGNMTKLAEALCIVGGIAAVVAAYYSYNSYEMTQTIMESLRFMYEQLVLNQNVVT